ncbi:outer membrane beta-barrel protein [Sediminibacterium soli]|uniref:outer membrane beta-barrel protein n=1 Tax=Sediminibacterium soli TaxID=2698829 RepID=UPI0013798094|nr:outer membrane beta-barrel protein [Sediminibacterium soli]NCI47825.1 TonB-dependent receptor [Sediminibacterium soli]
MRKITAFMIGLLAAATAVHSQDAKGKVSVTIFGAQQDAIENVTVELLKAKDSTLARTAISDRNGVADFEGVRTGSYLIRASFINYTTVYSAVFTVSAEQPGPQGPPLRLNPSAAQVGEVVVTARKPFLQKLSDRLVVNVDNSIVSAGSSAMDVLERAPGVAVDQNDAIGLRGKQGVIIMIDGKPTPLSGADLANYLRGLPSSAIERIDIITNPSARYDAAGNSGIIDIRMKKDQRLGFNGTVTAGYGQGVYPKTNTGTTFNYRNKAMNLFGNYNYSYRANFNHLVLDRNFYTNNKYNGGDLKDNSIYSTASFHAIRAGADFFPGKKNILGFVVTQNTGDFRVDASNASLVINDNRQLVSTFATRSGNNSNNDNIVVNVNFKHAFNTTGKELTADADYGVYRSDAISFNHTSYYQLNGTPAKPAYLLDGDQRGTLTLRTAKLDYTNPLPKGARFETGYKTSYVSSDNDAKFWDRSSGTAVDDPNKTNRFFYDEYNNAAYLNFSKEYGKFNMQLGLRGEHTRLKTHQVKGNSYFDSSYFQLFPSAFFNYKLKEDQTLGISVSRRIDRPGYSQLNPFLFLIDVTTYATGNPWLLPQFTWSYEMSYTLKNINFTLGYSKTTQAQNITILLFRDAFPGILQPDNVTVQMPINLSSTEYYGVTVAAPLRIGKYWNMVNNINAYYNTFHGSIGVTQLNRGRLAFDYRMNNTFTLKKGWVLEFNGNFSSGGQYGFMVTDPQWAVAAGVQKSVLKNKGTLRFNITDIFWTTLPKAVITYNNYVEKWHASRETRVANLSFTYRFGKTTVQAARKRTTASEEERQRAGN